MHIQVMGRATNYLRRQHQIVFHILLDGAIIIDFWDLSPRAWSSATVNVSGMSATHTIKVEFTYSS